MPTPMHAHTQPRNASSGVGAAPDCVRRGCAGESAAAPLSALTSSPVFVVMALCASEASCWPFLRPRANGHVHTTRRTGTRRIRSANAQHGGEPDARRLSRTRTQTQSTTYTPSRRPTRACQHPTPHHAHAQAQVHLGSIDVPILPELMSAWKFFAPARATLCNVSATCSAFGRQRATPSARRHPCTRT